MKGLIKIVLILLGVFLALGGGAFGIIAGVVVFIAGVAL